MNNDEIFERIARIDPVSVDASLDPATSARASDLKGHIMSNKTPESAAVARPRRTVRWISAGAVAVGAVVVVLAVTRSGGDSDLEPIVFSAAQSTLSSRTAGAAEAASDVALPNNKMALAPGAPMVTVEYEVEGDLPALDGKAQSWKSKGAPTSKQMRAVAKALGVEGDLVERQRALTESMDVRGRLRLRA